MSLGPYPPEPRDKIDRLRRLPFHLGYKIGHLLRLTFHFGHEIDQLLRLTFHLGHEIDQLLRLTFHLGHEIDQLLRLTFHLGHEIGHLGRLRFDLGDLGDHRYHVQFGPRGRKNWKRKWSNRPRNDIHIEEHRLSKKPLLIRATDGARVEKVLAGRAKARPSNA